METENASSPGRRKARQPYVKLPKAILCCPDLGAVAKLVYSLITDYMRGKDRAWPGLRTLAKELAVSEKTVMRAVRELESLKLIEVIRGRNGQRNTYVLPHDTSQERGRNSNGALGQSAGKTPTVRQSQTVGVLSKSVEEMTTKALEKLPHKKTRLKKKTTTWHKRAQPKRTQSAHQKLVEYFTQQWSERVGGGATYPFAGSKDGKAVKRILEAVDGDLEHAKRIVDAYLADPDPWLQKTGRDLTLLSGQSRLAKYIAATAEKPRAEETTTPADLEHPFVKEARGRWPEDVEAHPQEWQVVTAMVENGELSPAAIKRSDAKTGAEFRAQVVKEDRTHAAVG